MGDVGQGDVVAIWGCGAPAMCLPDKNKLYTMTPLYKM